MEDFDNEGKIATKVQENNEVMLSSRWRSFCGVCLLVSVAGTTYAFGILGSLLKNNLSYSQSQLDLIASIGNTGLYLSLASGFAFERYGFTVVIVFGSCCIFVGFFYIWLAICAYIPSNLWSMSVFYFVSQIGTCCFVSTAVTISVKLFPPQARGTAIGLCKGYFGLSSAVLADFSGGYFESVPSLYLLFIAVFIPCTGMIGISNVDLLPDHLISLNYEFSRGVSKSLRKILYHWGILFSILLLVGYIQYKFVIGSALESTLAIILLLVVYSILLFPILYGSQFISLEDQSFVTAGVSSNFNTFGTEHKSDEREISPMLPLSDKMMQGSPTIDVAIEVENSYYGPGIPFTESVKTWRLWATFLIYLVTCGTSLMVIYNVNSIAVAVNRSPSSFFIALISMANGFGRVSAGYLSDKITKFIPISKLQMLNAIIVGMGCTQFLLSFGVSLLLEPCLLAIGFLFGCNVSLMAVNVSDIFGSRYIATNFGLVDTAPIFGSYIFATWVVTALYEDNVESDEGVWSCEGVQCFRTAFLVNALFCMLASALCTYMGCVTPRDKAATVP